MTCICVANINKELLNMLHNIFEGGTLENI